MLISTKLYKYKNGTTFDLGENLKEKTYFFALFFIFSRQHNVVPFFIFLFFYWKKSHLFK